PRHHPADPERPPGNLLAGAAGPVGCGRGRRHAPSDRRPLPAGPGSDSSSIVSSRPTGRSDQPGPVGIGRGATGAIRPRRRSGALSGTRPGVPRVARFAVALAGSFDRATCFSKEPLTPDAARLILPRRETARIGSRTGRPAVLLAHRPVSAGTV